jgi:hypothetical protein
MQGHDKLQKNEMSVPVLPITIFPKCWEKNSSISFFQYDVSPDCILAKLYFQNTARNLRINVPPNRLL